MLCLGRCLVVVLALALVFILSTPSLASADAGAVCAASRGRPSCTILRPARESAGGRASAALGAPECIVLVGGLGSPTTYDERFFAPLLEGMEDDPRFTQIRFGVTAGSYRTYGAISRNGEELRSLIRHLSTACPAIHVLSHSMGSAVADRAFSMGDLATDGVVTYVALSGPHNGATGARAVRPAVETDVTFVMGVSAVTRAIGTHDPTTDAVRDLARIHAPRPIRDVGSVRLRLVTDEIVLRRDNADRRVDVREYLPTSGEQIEGHGGIVHHGIVQEVVRTTIASHHVPPEERSASELREADLTSIAMDAALAELEDGARIALLAAAFTTRSVVGPVSAALSVTLQR